MRQTDSCCIHIKIICGAIILAVVGAVVMAGCRSMPRPAAILPVQPQGDGSKVVARVNGEALSRDALARQYDLYFTLSGDSGAYQQEVSQRAFLSRYILEILLLQEARMSDVRVSPEQLDAQRATYLEETGLSEKELADKLSRAGLGMADADRFFENNLVIDQWSRIKFSALSVSIEEALAFYNENPALFIRDPDRQDAAAIPFEAVKDAIRENLTTSRIQSALFSYAMELRDAADIQLYDVEDDAGNEAAQTDGQVPLPAPETDRQAGPFPTFKETGQDPCTDDSGRPLILLFSAASCAHCQWVGGMFDLVAEEYAGRGLVAAHHYDIETGDDLLTEAVETRIPEAHLSIGRRGDPAGYLPYFNFGCSYDRIGTGYEEQDDLAAEAEEMCRVIETLLP